MGGAGDHVGPEGRYVATGSMDDTARVFAAASGREVSRLVQGERFARSPDGRYLATWNVDGARVFEAATGRESPLASP